MSSIAASSASSSTSLGLGNTVSGGISFVGLGSGTDFQSMIEQLKKVESIPKNRLELWRADWQRRVNAFDELIDSVGKLSTKFRGMDAMSTFMGKLVSSTNSSAVSAVASSEAPLGAYKINVTQLASNAMLTTKTPLKDTLTDTVLTSKSASIAPSDSLKVPPNYIFSYTYGTTTRTLNIPQGTNMQSFLNIINNDGQNPGVTASLIRSGDGYIFQLMGKDTGINNGLEINSTTDLPGFTQNDPFDPNPQISPWHIRAAQDAEFYLEGRDAPDQRMSSHSNALTEVIPGLTINLTDVTETGGVQKSVMLTVTNDAASTKQRVMEFVNGVNELLLKFKELTKIDKSKSVLDPHRSASQLATQKGSVLTGNYGVQLLNSKIKSMSVSTGNGFLPLERDGKGDVFWNLATIGITMDADENSRTFGLLVIKEGESESGSPFKTLDEALAQDPHAVAELLAADKIARSNSPDFSYTSMVSKDMVKAGTHDVKYKIDAPINPMDPPVVSVLIDGVAADYDSETGEWTSKAEGSRGLSIRMDNLTPTSGWQQGALNVKQGKINELSELFKSELKGANFEVGTQTDEKGALHVLRENYLDIIKNIDKKIEQEEARLILWETRMRAQFARLDTLLSNYEKQMTSNEAALNSASTNYSGNKKK